MTWREHVAESSVGMCVGNKHSVFAAELPGSWKCKAWAGVISKCHLEIDYEKNSKQVQKEHLISPNSSFQKPNVSYKLDIWAFPVAYGEGDTSRKNTSHRKTDHQGKSFFQGASISLPRLLKNN